MNYRNSEMKIDQIISYFNQEKINLIPPFQRGHVWNPTIRKKLLKNMVMGRPIPAIFLYKEASGSKYSYNILDGKQRLESLLLFVGGKREDIKLDNVFKYFFEQKLRDLANFKIELDGKNLGFENLDESVVRDFREYAIPTIEITLTEDSALDEVISLFVDINQQGVAVNRFDVVKALGKDPLLKNIFSLIAEEQRRKEALHYRAKRNEFTGVLRHLAVVAQLADGNSRVDRMWERLMEIALFARTGKHRTPVDILKSFIKSSERNNKLSRDEVSNLRRAFRFLQSAYKAKPKLTRVRLATDQPQFYTLITSLISTDLMDRYSADELIDRLVTVGLMIDDKHPIPKDRKKLATLVKSYRELSEKATTNIGRREARQQRFIEMVDAVGSDDSETNTQTVLEL
jgi:hypothetical protein